MDCLEGNGSGRHWRTRDDVLPCGVDRSCTSSSEIVQPVVAVPSCPPETHLPDPREDVCRGSRDGDATSGNDAGIDAQIVPDHRPINLGWRRAPMLQDHHGKLLVEPQPPRRLLTGEPPKPSTLVDGNSRDRGKIIDTVVVHIGTHKTGTTSFQAALAARVDDLASHGIRVFHSDVIANQGIASELPLLAVRPELTFPMRVRMPDTTLPSALDAMRRRVRAEVETRTPVLIASHEGLSYIRTTDEVERLRELLDGREVRIVVVLRDKESFLVSWRGQLERMGYSTTSPYIDSFMNTSADSWITDWDTLVRVYGDVFGPEAITVLDYDLETQRRGSVVPALWTAMGLPEDFLPARSDPWLNTAAQTRAPTAVLGIRWRIRRVRRFVGRFLRRIGLR